ncbi:triose-phosphate isomerase [Selenomonas sp. F0473]|uniref:triose-phosphate isomerase n=1 Tax=Selenomonas sp. F0473 TaxID=999423 RepID=UPI0025FD4E9F|nr:triose-phosphate isomerase [Selenomonas sp. F0473]
MKSAISPFLVVNPKSYLYGAEALALAQAADAAAKKTGLKIYFTCPFSDIRYIRAHTESIIVTAQAMESLKPGRGMGHLLPEAIRDAGARATFLNHAENPMTVAELSKTILRARGLGIETIACADSLAEGTAIAAFRPDILLCEPTDLIGTGKTADDNYTVSIVAKIRSVDPAIGIMIASGITTADDVYRVVRLGADGSGATSGILNAPDPGKRIEEMAEAIVRAAADRASADNAL